MFYPPFIKNKYEPEKDSRNEKKYKHIHINLVLILKY